MQASFVARIAVGTAAAAVVSTLAWAQAVPVKIVPITAVPPASSTSAPANATAPSPAAPPPAAPTPAVTQPATPAISMPAASVPVITPAAPAAPAARTLELSFSNGAVTLVAANVTVREILQEWGRRGGTKIVDGDKLTGGPVTLEFHRAPEAAVIGALLRDAAGYLTFPRQSAVADASVYQRIAILPVSRPTAAGFSPPQPVYQPIPNPDESIPPVIPPGAMPRPPQTPAGPPPPAVVIAPVTPVKPGGGGGGGGGAV